MNLSVRLAILPVAAVLFACTAAAADVPPEPAQTVINAAVHKATAENKAVLVHFSASW